MLPSNYVAREIRNVCKKYKFYNNFQKPSNVRTINSILSKFFNVKTPVAVPENTIECVHGEDIDNSFDWLRKKSKKTMKYIQAENKYTDQYFFKQKKHVQEIKEFFTKLNSNFADEIHSYEERQGNYIYYFDSCPGKLPNLYRRHFQCKVGSPEQLVIDQNALSESTGFVSLGGLKISPAEELAAALVDQTGDGNFNCHIIEILNEAKQKYFLKNVSSLEWLSNDVLVYSIKDGQTSRSNKIFLLALNSYPKECLLYKENDTRFSLNINKSKSEEIVFMTSSTKLSTEVWYFEHGVHELRLLWSRKNNKEAYIDHMGETFYNLTTDEKDEYCIKYLNNDSMEWNELVNRTFSKNVIADMDLFKDKLVVYETKNLIPRLQILSHYNKEMSYIKQVTKTAGILECNGRKSHADHINFTFTSPIQPITNYQLNISTDLLQKTSSLIPEWNTELFEYTHIESTTKDNTSVPISVFYKKGINVKEAAMLCHVYGSYGVPVSLRFNQLDAYLLSKGWIVAYPHVRGGNELGRNWYNNGRRRNKNNTFQDLASCIETLHRNDFSNHQFTALQGKSAGGLPVAVLMNQQSDLFTAAILQVSVAGVLQ